MIYIVAEAHGFARINKMLVDILWWALDSPLNINLIVLSKHVKEDFTVCIIQSLETRDYNVLLAEPVSKSTPFTESSTWLWEKLCQTLSSSDGGGSSQRGG